ncbi:MAG: phospholipid-binding protein MlaC [Holosporales bacterium]|jgi:phospholipid transport system substrate-binding protein
MLRNSKIVVWFVLCLLGVPAWGNQPTQTQFTRVQSKTSPTPTPVVSFPKQAEAFVTSLAEMAIRELTDQKISEEQRLKRFQQLYRGHFDAERIAPLVLGRYWPVATYQQQQEFVRLFEYANMLNYRERLRRYRGHTLQVIGSLPLAQDQVRVLSVVTNPVTGRIVQVGWRVARDRAGLRILDMEIEGFSMVAVLRNQYGATIQRSGGRVEGLLYELRLAAAQLSSTLQ